MCKAIDDMILDGKHERTLEGKLDMVRSMLQHNEPIEKIIKYSKLDRDIIEKERHAQVQPLS